MAEHAHNFDGPDPALVQRLSGLFEGIARYHRHEVHGLQHIPADGPALLALHHSFATYDGLLLGSRIGTETGRWAAGLGDDKLFSFSRMRHLVSRCGIVPASPEHGARLLSNGQLVVVAPGGMREALRPSTEARRARWDRRKGFVRLALRSGAPIIPAACPRADDLFTVYDNRLTKLVYKRWRFPVAVVRGLGPTLMPRPVKLVHYIGEPIPVPPLDEARFDAQVDEVHAEVMASVNTLLSRR